MGLLPNVNKDENENLLFEEFWKTLEGQKLKGVRIVSLEVALKAILRIPFTRTNRNIKNKTSGVDFNSFCTQKRHGKTEYTIVKSSVKETEEITREISSKQIRIEEEYDSSNNTLSEKMIKEGEATDLTESGIQKENTKQSHQHISQGLIQSKKRKIGIY